MLSGNAQTKKLHFISKRLTKLLTQEELNTFETKQFKTLRLNKGFKSARYSALNKRVNWIRASDHWIFHQQGIPFIYYGVGTHKNYHKETDTVENSNFDFFVKVTNAIYHQLKFLDKVMAD